MNISKEILNYLHYHPRSSRREIADGISFQGSDTTLKRHIAAEINLGNIILSTSSYKPNKMKKKTSEADVVSWLDEDNTEEF